MPSLFRALDGPPTLGCTLNFGIPLSAQIMSRIGYDFVLVDMEHNPISAREASYITQSIVSASGGRCKPIVRVPSHGVEWIKWALDCGADGILIPMVQTAAEMEAIIQHAVYPPRGQRSFGPTMAPFASTDPTTTAAKYLARAREIAVIPMIESVRGIENLEAISAINGVTAIFVGPVDLRFSMGLQGGDGRESEYLNTLARIVQVGRRLGKPVGTFAADAHACKTRAVEGFDFLLLPGEVAMLAAGAKQHFEECAKAVGSPRL